MDIALDLTRARGRLHRDGDGVMGFPWLLAQHLSEVHALAVTPIHGQMGRAHPKDNLGLFPDRLDDRGRIGIPTVRKGDIPRPQRKVHQAFRSNNHMQVTGKWIDG
jgi:hypothetical protein